MLAGHHCCCECVPRGASQFPVSMGASVRSARGLCCAPMASPRQSGFWSRITHQFSPARASRTNSGPGPEVAVSSPRNFRVATDRGRFDKSCGNTNSSALGAESPGFRSAVAVHPSRAGEARVDSEGNLSQHLARPDLADCGNVLLVVSGQKYRSLSTARQLVVHPRIHWIETVFASILIILALVAVVGLLTSTPDDRRDTQFMTLMAGALFWGLLVTTTIAARFLQWRIAKHR